LGRHEGISLPDKRGLGKAKITDRIHRIDKIYVKNPDNPVNPVEKTVAGTARRSVPTVLATPICRIEATVHGSVRKCRKLGRHERIRRKTDFIARQERFG
jgi:hypothetical protein